MLLRVLLTAIALGAGTSAAYAARIAIAHPAPAAVKVDGVLNEWRPGLYATSPPLELGLGAGTVESGALTSNQDARALVYLGHNAEGIYVASIVHDDDIEAAHQKGEIWRGDVLEFILCVDRKRKFHFGIGASGDLHFFEGMKKQQPKHVLSKAGRFRGGYTLESFIPWNVLGADPKHHAFWINVGLKDVDGKNAPTNLVWSGARLKAHAGLVSLRLETPSPSNSKLECGVPASKRIGLSQPLQTRGRRLTIGEQAVRLKGLNFQGGVRAWENFWNAWEPEKIRRDLDRVVELRANVIRVFVFFELFGAQEVSKAHRARLRWLVDEAAQRGILSIVSFFPFKKDFRPERWGEMGNHMVAISRDYVGDPAIAMWDLMNEPDHAWKENKSASVREVKLWAQYMMRTLRKTDPTHLVTIGLAGHFMNQSAYDPDQALDFVDVISVHWYFDRKKLRSTLAKARRHVHKPIVLQEFGSTGLIETQHEAATYYGNVCSVADALQLAGIVAWELYDHPMGTLPWLDKPMVETTENYYGLYSSDGVPKEQASTFCRCFDAPRFKLNRPGQSSSEE